MKKILIITNPYSGKKQGSKILSNIVDLFKNIPSEIITTEYKNHPYDIANKIDVPVWELYSIRDQLIKNKIISKII